MVYIVQHRGYSGNEVVGLFHALHDAAMCASEEELLKDVNCEIFFMPVQDATEYDDIECGMDLKFRYREEDLSQEVRDRMAMKRKRKEERICENARDKEKYMKEHVEKYKNLSKSPVLNNLMLMLNADDYKNLSVKLCKKQIVLEEYKERVEKIRGQSDALMRDIVNVWNESKSTGYSLSSVQHYVIDMLHSNGFYDATLASIPLHF
jgi:uncharacterized protein (UPF0335 family)